ncbi:MAG: hypothetical protein OEV64_07950, partial [Desulfobulbaceae bacterium]|nr:hypothetical protein [Desulfobulbaceae bacterium]
RVKLVHEHFGKQRGIIHGVRFRRWRVKGFGEKNLIPLAVTAVFLCEVIRATGLLVNCNFLIIQS